jgi:hypothetical protein
LTNNLAKFPLGKHLISLDLANEQALLYLSREDLDQARYAL